MLFNALVNNKDLDQTVWMCRLVCAFAVCKQQTGFLMSRPIRRWSLDYSKMCIFKGMSLGKPWRQILYTVCKRRHGLKNMVIPYSLNVFWSMEKMLKVPVNNMSASTSNQICLDCSEFHPAMNKQNMTGQSLWNLQQRVHHPTTHVCANFVFVKLTSHQQLRL